MARNRKLISAKIAVGMAVVPALIYAYRLGPDPGHTGAPGDQTCAISGCHVGTALNGGGGNVTLTSAAGTTYTPGQQQTLTITITDSKAKIYGFQMTARLDSNPTGGQAGDFIAGAQQMVLCARGDLKPNGKLCPANESIEFIEHNQPFTSNTINVTWTPPSSDAGSVTLYVAVNAANNDNTNFGDHIYTTQLTLSPPSSGGGTPPSIASGGVQSAGAFSAKAGVAPGTWVEIYGSNLSTSTRGWTGSDFNNGNAPTSLDGVSVTIGGKSAYVAYISPNQVNVQAPDGIPIGAGVPLVLTNSAGQTAPYALETASVAPALLAPGQTPFNVNGKQFVAAQMSDASFGGIPSHAAKPGDIVTLYGIGFGPVSPTTGAGVLAGGPTSLVNQVTILFNQTPAQVSYAGLAPGLVGLYQFNVKVPDVTPGDYQIKLNGAPFSQTIFISVGQ